MTASAYATTSTSMPGADAGILITNSYVDDSGYESDGEVLADETVGTELDAEDGDLDYDAADELLARMGYRRTDTWVPASGQWTTSVEAV